MPQAALSMGVERPCAALLSQSCSHPQLILYFSPNFRGKERLFAIYMQAIYFLISCKGLTSHPRGRTLRLSVLKAFTVKRRAIPFINTLDQSSIDPPSALNQDSIEPHRLTLNWRDGLSVDLVPTEYWSRGWLRYWLLIEDWRLIKGMDQHWLHNYASSIHDLNTSSCFC